MTPTTFDIHQYSELRSKNTSEQSVGMVKIPSGLFDMGSLEKDNEEPVHIVEISSFLMDIKPVTVGEFRKLTFVFFCAMNFEAYPIDTQVKE